MNLKPTFDEVKKIVAEKKFKVIPLSCEILSDIATPIEVLRILKNVSAHCYMLESVAEQEKWGRYTFLGFEPKLCITCTRGKMKIGEKEFPREACWNHISSFTGLEINGESGLMPCMRELADIKRKYDRIRGALDQVEAVGYGIVMPSIDELTLEEPEIVRQGGKYGVKLRASAPSIHLMRADITTEVAPIVGSEKQSEDLVRYLLDEFEGDPAKIWESNIFGKSLHELVNEGLHTKLSRMPQEARLKLQETISRIINEGCSGLICLIL